jgi:hypothetical protein
VRTLLQGFCCAQVQAMLGQARLLESSYTFNASIIAQIDAHLQQRVLPQLQARVVSTMQRLRLQDAAQQAQLINQAAADVMAVCTPELQRDMHVVSGQAQHWRQHSAWLLCACMLCLNNTRLRPCVSVRCCLHLLLLLLCCAAGDSAAAGLCCGAARCL